MAFQDMEGLIQSFLGQRPRSLFGLGEQVRREPIPAPLPQPTQPLPGPAPPINLSDLRDLLPPGHAFRQPSGGLLGQLAGPLGQLGGRFRTPEGITMQPSSPSVLRAMQRGGPFMPGTWRPALPTSPIQGAQIPRQQQHLQGLLDRLSGLQAQTGQRVDQFGEAKRGVQRPRRKAMDILSQRVSNLQSRLPS